MKMKFLHYFLGNVMKILVDTQILICYGKNELQKMAPKAIPIIQNFNRPS